MKKFILFATAISFISCGSRKVETQKSETKEQTTTETKTEVQNDIQTISDNKTVEIIPTDTTQTATVSIKDTILPDGTKFRIYKVNKARIVVSDTKTLQSDKSTAKVTKTSQTKKSEAKKQKHIDREQWNWWWLFWLIILVLLYLFARYFVLRNYL
jgi:hypothetical protein